MVTVMVFDEKLPIIVLKTTTFVDMLKFGGLKKRVKKENYLEILREVEILSSYANLIATYNLLLFRVILFHLNIYLFTLNQVEILIVQISGSFRSTL